MITDKEPIETIESRLSNYYGTVTIMHNTDGYFMGLGNWDDEINYLEIGLDAYSELRKVFNRPDPHARLRNLFIKEEE
jgi:hypothetical protein